MDASDYTQYRPLMFSIAYRMTGSVSDAEDIVQEAFLRAARNYDTADNQKAYLATITTRLAIDHLRSARVRRESYVGTWLPEPLLGYGGADDRPGPAELAETSDSLSMAFLVLLESLSPPERAVFLLREVFGYGYPEIAEITGKTEPACRQTFARARRRIDEGRPRFETSRAEGEELASLFLAAARGGDMSSLFERLAPDVLFYGDSGGLGEITFAVPITGRDRVAELVRAQLARTVQLGASLEAAWVNGQPGLLARDADGGLIAVIALDVLDGQVQAIRTVANPDKLRHLGPISETWHLRQGELTTTRCHARLARCVVKGDNSAKGGTKMRVFVAGATGVIGQFLVPGLITAGHEVTGSTRSSAKAATLKTQGATPVIVDGLDRDAVLKAVTAAQPEVIIHQMTALTSMRSLRNLDKTFAVTNELRSTGTDYLLEAAQQAGARRFIAQSFTGWNNTRSGSQVKTEEDPLDPHPLAGTTKSLAALRHLEEAVLKAVTDGLVLRYGILYGHGASDLMLEAVRKRQMPVVGGGTGIWSFTEVTDAAAATVAAVTRGAPGIYNVVDDDPAPASQWVPYLASSLGAKPPMRAPAWVGRLLGGELVASWMTQGRGASNAKAKRELGWTPAYPSWRDGFPAWAKAFTSEKAA
jgi:2-alkyl-3-oxoalkanoate reductase